MGYPANDIFLLSAISVKPVYPVSHTIHVSAYPVAKISQGPTATYFSLSDYPLEQILAFSFQLTRTRTAA